MGRELENIDLTVAQRKEILSLLKRYLPDTEVWAYGSRVKFTAKPSSDLDMVAFATKKQSLAVANLKEAFEESSLPFWVDFFVWDEVPEQFHKNIEDERVVLQGKKEERDLPEGWAETTLGTMLSFANGKKSPLREDSFPFPVYGSNGIIGKSRDTNADTMSLIIGRVGSYCGSVYQTKTKCWVTDNAIKANAIGDNDPTFLFYLLTSLNLNNWRGGSGQPLLNQSILSSISVKAPDPVTQKAIAHILGSLDDKIELNRRMNETLEAMAQALFKSWFVDFDPVIDNALIAGNPLPEELQQKGEVRRVNLEKKYGSLEAAAESSHFKLHHSHFPSEFIQTDEMGWIPKGWSTGKVRDLGEVICGKTPPTNDPENYGTEIPFITIPDMYGTVYITHTSKTLSRKGADTQKKKYLPANSICVSCIATPGLVVLNSEESQTNQQINSVIPNDIKTAFFAYEVLSRLGEQIRNAGSGGSVFSNLSKGRFEELKILLGNSDIQMHFNGKVQPYFEKILSNQKSVNVLSHARDTLLPQLLSGEMRIPEAEKLVEEIGMMRDEL